MNKTLQVALAVLLITSGP